MNTLLESIIAIVSMIASNWLLKRNDFEGKTKSILAVLIGLVVWIALPYAFDDVSAVSVAEDSTEDTKERAKMLNKVAEAGWDHITSFVRIGLSVVILIVVLIAMAMS
jgi:hypothetical protein